MKKIISLIIVCTIIISGMFIYGQSDKKDLLEDNNGPIIAAVIDGKASTTFPTTNKYTATVECTRNGIKQDVGAKATWNGSKWVVSIGNISAGNVRCNATFITKVPTLAETILANNEIKTPLTTPGSEVSAYTKDDVESQTASVSSTYQSYYFTYGTGWEANGTKFNLTGTAVTSGTYANSYSSLVGKYIVSSSASGNGSSSSSTKKTTTNLSEIYYVVSASASSFTYKILSSTKNITETLLASTEDDYGTSYYFRGAVKNNYVQFANKCWRIVRIVGDGSVKLILHNDNTSKVASPCSSANNNKTAAFATYSGTMHTSYFNIDSEDNSYVGFMFGATGASDYASTHANTNKSTILTNLETWYKSNLASYEDKLADTIWCNDKSTDSDSLGYSNNKTFYGAYERLSANQTASLICSNDKSGGKLSKFTVSDTINGNGNLTYKIGLLTADEVAFAGSISSTYNRKSTHNISTFLYENAADNWWTLSPFDFDGDYSDTYYVTNGYLDSEFVSTEYGLRPAISLVSDTEISGGSGTSENPYIVN